MFKKNKGAVSIQYLALFLLIIGVSIIVTMLFINLQKGYEISKINDKIEHLSESKNYDLERSEIANRIQLVKQDILDSKGKGKDKDDSGKYSKYEEDISVLETNLANQDREHDRKIAKQVETK